MAETGVAVIISMGDYLNATDNDSFNSKVNDLVDLQTKMWGEKNMGYKLITLDEKSGYLSKNSLFDFIKQTRFNINNNNYDYLVINIIGKGNEEYLISSDNQNISLEKIYELFSFDYKFFVPTVFNIDVFNPESDGNKTFESVDVDNYGDNLNVFGYSSKNIEYFGFITNAIYQRRKAIYLKDVVNHVMIWNQYIFTVPKDIDFDDDEDDHDYEQREGDDDDEKQEITSIFDENVKSVTSTEKGGNDWSVTFSIDRKSWGPFLAKYDYSAFVHDKNNNRKEIKSLELEIERPIGVKKSSKFKKKLLNGSFINETIREEGGNAVGNTSLSVKVTNWNNMVITTKKIIIS